MEDQPMVCYSMGAINTLVDKIKQLMKNHPMIGDLLQGLEILRKDHVNKLAGGRATREQIRVWMKQVREMVYDIEDWIDLKQEAANFGESDKIQIDEFKDQIQEALSRCKRYQLLNQAPTSDAELVYAGSSDAAIIGRGLLWEEKTVLFGINDPKSELLNHLKNEQKELKVVSILGTGGHGKTTLAKEIYGDIKARFDCQAFVSVGRTTSMRTTLLEILRQVKSEAYARQARSCNEGQMNEVITELWEFLRTKRYFICIDDIRCTRASKVLNCALPDNNFGSRILTTTRVKDIAISCSRRPNDVVYEMIPLDEDDSKNLFSLYVREEEWPDHFKETSKKLFKGCGGVPLAIIITAGLLGRAFAEPSGPSKMLNETISSEFDQFYSTSQAMKTVLDISYGDLPLPLKSCFLYLSAFSGNYHINKDRLIRRWVAEGLIPEKHGKSSWETGESYFDELISRRLIQPAFDDNDDQPIGCTVHGVVVDFMESLSTEENFITTGAELKSGLFPCDRVRRVSLHCSDEDEGDTLFSNTYCLLEQNSWVASSSDENSSSYKDEGISLHLSMVRSLAFSGDATRIPDLSAFKHVRVLDLEDTKGLENKQLESIGRLSLLRYLGLGGTDATVLPPEIMALDKLSTLDLRRSKVRELPAFRDTKLVSLLAHDLTIRRGMGGIQELEELSEVRLGSDGSLADDVAGLVNKLRRLRMLGVRFGYVAEMERPGVKHFLKEVGKSSLRSLFLDDYRHHLLDLLVDCWTHERPQYLQKFELRMYWCKWPSKVPQEMPSLKDLTHLHIGVSEVEAQGVRALGKLPKLVLLKLYSDTSPRFTVSSKDGFPCLKLFRYCCEHGGAMGLQFEAGAMPHLRRLLLDFNASETNFVFGIQHLSCLVQVRATIYCGRTSTASVVEAVEAHIRDQVSQNTNNPVLELNRKRRGHLTPHQGPCSTVKAAAVPAEGSVIAIHSLDEWSIQIDEANRTDPKKLVVIDFTASWCPPSRIMDPVFADLANKFPTVVFLKVDVVDDEMKTIAEEFSVEGIPTFLFMKGGDVKDRVVGANKEELAKMLDLHMAQ